MPIAAKKICSAPGCLVITSEARCARHKQQPRELEKYRESAHQRGYTFRWTKLSQLYRRMNPLCVMCMNQGQRIVAATCVDHIIPARCCTELTMCWDNLQSSCGRCNTRKKLSDPKELWTPNYTRIVVCGLRGTGKTTFAKSTGYAMWDTDEHPELTTYEQVQRARDEWINRLSSAQPCAVIVGSTITAPQIAAKLRGVVKHMTRKFVNREPHPIFGGV